MWIVLAWLRPDVEVVRARRTDLGERPFTREVMRPEALVWLRHGTEADIPKARGYAATQGYTVFTFPPSEKDPLGAARLRISGDMPDWLDP